MTVIDDVVSTVEDIISYPFDAALTALDQGTDAAGDAAGNLFGGVSDLVLQLALIAAAFAVMVEVL